MKASMIDFHDPKLLMKIYIYYSKAVKKNYAKIVEKYF